MSVMAETSQSAMRPYFAMAAAGPVLNAWTAVFREALVVKVFWIVQATSGGLGGDGEGGEGLGSGGDGEGGEGLGGGGDGGGGGGGGGGAGWLLATANLSCRNRTMSLPP